MSTSPLENLELRALQQRNRLHQRAIELKTKITAVRKKLDVATNAREHFTEAAMVVGALCLVSGYGVAGMFTRH
jgi:hypothetical protein